NGSPLERQDGASLEAGAHQRRTGGPERTPLHAAALQERISRTLRPAVHAPDGRYSVQMRGSSRSRRPSPRRLNPRTVSAIAAPGRTAIHGSSSMYCRAALSINPQEAVGGWVPRPRKLSAASVRMAVERDTVVCTIKGAETFGTTCRSMIFQLGRPTARAASM